MRFKNHYSLTISKLDEIGSSVQMSTDVENQVPSLVDVQGHMNESYNLIKAVGEYFIQRNRTRELQKRVNTGKEVLDNYLVEEKNDMITFCPLQRSNLFSLLKSEKEIGYSAAKTIISKFKPGESGESGSQSGRTD